MVDLVIGYLSFLNEENFKRRSAITTKSSKSFYDCILNQVDSCIPVIINNGTLVPRLLSQFKTINLSKNYYDVAIHYGTAFYAEKLNAKYFAYVYDDFYYYNDSFVEQSVNFLNETGINSMRIPAYGFANNSFNMSFTDKSQNPDSVRHDVGANNEPLFQTHVRDNFYETNWRPNSRPMIWNTEFFLKYFALKNSPIMQSFEAHMYNVADGLASRGEWLSSFLDGGICSTVDQNLSERTRTPFNKLAEKSIDTDELKSEICLNS